MKNPDKAGRAKAMSAARITLLLSLLVAFPSMATDMYLPALPGLQRLWGVSMALANISLVAFFAAISTMMLVYGPVSDRFGRKPVLCGGLSLFILGSLGCAVAPGVYWLIAARTLQGLGAAAANTLAIAITKDLFDGSQRQKVLGYIGVIFALCPMIAPTIGGWMIAMASWRYIFLVQAGMAVVAMAGVLRLREPLQEKAYGGLLAMAGRYLRLLKNREYVTLTAAFSVMMLALFGFIGGAPDIYINGFGVSEQEFGLHFGVNASGLMAGSMLCARLSGKISSSLLLWLSMFGMLAAAAAFGLSGGAAPYVLTGVMVLNSFCMGVNRPISNNMILEAVDEDFGAASSLMMFCFTVTGILAMSFISFDWSNKALVLNCMMAVGAMVPMLVLVAKKTVADRPR